jgi:hypothetical protein
MIAEDRPATKKVKGAAQQLAEAPQEVATEKLGQAKQLITDHPLITIGGAFAVGALIGLLRPRAEKKGLLRGLVGGIAMALIREAVLDRVSNYANGWIDMKSREEAASRQQETEAFVEH